MAPSKILANCETLEENLSSFEVTNWSGLCINIFLMYFYVLVFLRFFFFFFFFSRKVVFTFSSIKTFTTFLKKCLSHINETRAGGFNAFKKGILAKKLTPFFIEIATYRA